MPGQIIRRSVVGVRLFPSLRFILPHEVRQTDWRIFDVRAAFRRRSCDALDPSDPPEPVPEVPKELCHLNDRRHGNEQRKDLGNVNFPINIPYVETYLAKTKRERIVLCGESAKFHGSDPICHRERDDRHELNKRVVISDRSPALPDQHQCPIA